MITPSPVTTQPMNGSVPSAHAYARIMKPMMLTSKPTKPITLGLIHGRSIEGRTGLCLGQLATATTILRQPFNNNFVGHR